MKFTASAVIILVLLTVPCSAKFETDINLAVQGMSAAWDISMSQVAVTIQPDNLFPGSTFSFDVNVTNSGNVDALVSYTIISAPPTWLNVDVTFDPDLLKGETDVITIEVSIDVGEGNSIASTSIDFIIEFNFLQN